MYLVLKTLTQESYVLKLFYVLIGIGSNLKGKFVAMHLVTELIKLEYL
jgi:hypothetical protein